MSKSFEKHLISLFDNFYVKEEDSSLPKKYFNNQYESAYDYYYTNNMTAPPPLLKKAIKEAFHNIRSFLNNEEFYNETSFFQDIHYAFKKINSWEKTSYFLAAIDAFNELKTEIPELNPGYFHSYFLYSLKDFNKKEKHLLITHYLKNNDLIFNDYPLNIINREFDKKSKRFHESWFTNYIINESIHNFFKLLSESDDGKQKIYKKLLPPNLNKLQINSFTKRNNEANQYPAKKIDFLKINQDILFEILTKKQLFQLRNNPFDKCILNDSLNEIIKHKFSGEDIFDLYIERIISYPENSIKNNAYDINLFIDENPYLYFNDYKHVKNASKNINNKLFKKLGLYKDRKNTEQLVSDYFNNQKILAEKKHLNKEIDVQDMNALRKRRI